MTDIDWDDIDEYEFDDEQYDEFTVHDVRKAIRRTDDLETLETILEYERETKERVTAIEEIEERHEEVEVEHSEYSPSYLTVRNLKSRTREIAGYTFGPNEAKRLPNTNRLQMAIGRGEVQVLRN